MEKIYIIDAIFQAKRNIYSLPHHHGARWSALLRFACKLLPASLEDILHGLLPLRNGQKAIKAGECLVLRLVAKERGLDFLAPLASAWRAGGEYGEFSPQSLDLLFWRDAIGQEAFASEKGPGRNKIKPLDFSVVRPEAELLLKMNQWSIIFDNPLRLKRPPGEIRPGGAVGKYCDAEFFSHKHAIQILLKEARLLTPPDFECPGDLLVTSTELSWLDMRYGKTRHVAFGGLVGRIECAGKLDIHTALRLAMGQYLGAGKSPLFGFGYWRMPQINGVSPIYFNGAG